MRNELLDLTTIVPATAYHQRNYVETYSRRKEAIAMRVRRQGKRSMLEVAERNNNYGTFYCHSAMMLYPRRCYHAL